MPPTDPFASHLSVDFERVRDGSIGYWTDPLPSFILRRTTAWDTGAGLYPRHFFDEKDAANVAMLDGHVEAFQNLKDEEDITMNAPGVKVENPNVRDPTWNPGQPLETLRDLRDVHWWLDPNQPTESHR